MGVDGGAAAAHGAGALLTGDDADEATRWYTARGGGRGAASECEALTRCLVDESGAKVWVLWEILGEGREAPAGTTSLDVTCNGHGALVAGLSGSLQVGI